MADVGVDEGSDDALRRPLGARATAAANRTWWDEEAASYYLEHGAFLGDDDLVWGPEGMREDEAGVLGEVAGHRVLEIGCGAAQAGRYLRSRDAQVVSTDLSAGMLAQGRMLNGRSETPVPLVQADALGLPFADETFDLVVTAYGAVPFVARADLLCAEAARVLRPSGRLVFSTTHPVRWAFPDDPGPDGLTVHQSYFDRTPYVEQDGRGRPTYAEHHRTLGDRVRDLTGAGLVLADLVEPEWPTTNRQVWGGWSPLRGALIPGTAIFVARKP